MGKKIERQIDLSELPIKNNTSVNKDKYFIDWVNAVGYKVKFKYDDVIGEVEIISYKNGKLIVKYSENDLFEISINNFKRCKFGKLLNKITNNFKIGIGTCFKDNKRDIVIIDRKVIKDNRNHTWKIYRYICNKCKNDKGWLREDLILRDKTGCQSCCKNPRVVVSEINSIVANEETHWMIPYFQGGYDEAKKYTKCSTKKIYLKCPNCGNIKNKKISPNQLYKNHSIGCTCGDGFSYPEKFMYSVLKQLNIDFEMEYSSEWIKPLRYDFYFELNDKKYIIETDGGWHYTNNNLSGKTKNESKAIDEYKDKIAQKYGVEVIRINCNCSNLEYIKNNILKSELNSLFDLAKVCWLKCEEFALSNLCKKACEIKKNNSQKSTKEIADILKLSIPTITKYLKIGMKLGWCNYNPKDEMIKSNSRNGKNNGKEVAVFKNDKKLGTFYSCAELERRSEELFGIKLLQSGISNTANDKQSQYKGFTFKYVNENSLDKIS